MPSTKWSVNKFSQGCAFSSALINIRGRNLPALGHTDLTIRQPLINGRLILVDPSSRVEICILQICTIYCLRYSSDIVQIWIDFIEKWHKMARVFYSVCILYHPAKVWTEMQAKMSKSQRCPFPFERFIIRYINLCDLAPNFQIFSKCFILE